MTTREWPWSPAPSTGRQWATAGLRRTSRALAQLARHLGRARLVRRRPAAAHWRPVEGAGLQGHSLVVMVSLPARRFEASGRAAGVQGLCRWRCRSTSSRCRLRPANWRWPPAERRCVPAWR